MKIGNGDDEENYFPVVTLDNVDPNIDVEELKSIVVESGALHGMNPTLEYIKLIGMID